MDRRHRLPRGRRNRYHRTRHCFNILRRPGRLGYQTQFILTKRFQRHGYLPTRHRHNRQGRARGYTTPAGRPTRMATGEYYSYNNGYNSALGRHGNFERGILKDGTRRSNNQRHPTTTGHSTRGNPTSRRYQVIQDRNRRHTQNSRRHYRRGRCQPSIRPTGS